MIDGMYSLVKGVERIAKVNPKAKGLWAIVVATFGAPGRCQSPERPPGSEPPPAPEGSKSCSTGVKAWKAK